MEGRVRRHRRPLFGPWLIQQINSNKYEGLHWVNSDPPMFCIPWRHLSKEISEKDYKIFKAWAIEGGKYDGRCENPSKWKTNFRNALESVIVKNRKMFTRVKNKPLGQPDSCKVYQLNCLQDLVAVTYQKTIDVLFQDLQLSSTQNGCTQESQLETEVTYGAGNDLMEYSYNSLWAKSGNPAMEVQNGLSAHAAVLPKENSLPTSRLHVAALSGEAPDHEMPLFNNSVNNGKEELQGYSACYGEGNGPIENSYQPLAEEERNQSTIAHGPIQKGPSPPAVVFQQTYFPQSPNLSAAVLGSLISLELTILYRGVQMEWQRVNSPCKLNYNSMSDSCLSHIPVVCFPCPDALPDQKQAEHTRRILEMLERGLSFEVSQEDWKIYATWLGKCKLYWAFSEQRENEAEILKPRSLRYQIRTEIFNFNQFWTELQEYKAGQRGSPDYTIYLTFGQQFSKKKRLVQVKLVPWFCVICHEMAQKQGASSLNSKSLSLQLSNSSVNNLYELIDSCSF